MVTRQSGGQSARLRLGGPRHPPAPAIIVNERRGVYDHLADRGDEPDGNCDAPLVCVGSYCE